MTNYLKMFDITCEESELFEDVGYGLRPTFEVSVQNLWNDYHNWVYLCVK